MKLTVNRALLLDALESVSRAVPSRPSHPVLGMFYLSATPETLTVRGFDLSLAIEKTIPLVAGDGEIIFTLPNKLTIEILSRLSDSSVEIEVEDSNDPDLAIFHTLKAGSAQTKLHALNPSDYPDFPSLDENSETVVFPSHIFVEACEKCSKVASTQEEKQILCGVNISGRDGKLEFAATNGHRLAYIAEDAEVEFNSKTFPVRALSEVSRIAKHSEAKEITVSLTDDALLVGFENGKVYSRMLQGAYPQYKALFPSSFSSILELDRKIFLSALELVSIIAGQEKTGTILVEWVKGKMTISSNAVDCGTAKQVIDCPEDTEGKILFNGKYLLDAVRFFDEDTILLQCNAPSQPVVFTEPVIKKSHYLVMPVQIRE